MKFLRDYDEKNNMKVYSIHGVLLILLTVLVFDYPSKLFAENLSKGDTLPSFGLETSDSFSVTDTLTGSKDPDETSLSGLETEEVLGGGSAQSPAEASELSTGRSPGFEVSSSWDDSGSEGLSVTPRSKASDKNKVMGIFESETLVDTTEPELFINDREDFHPPTADNSLFQTQSSEIKLEVFSNTHNQFVKHESLWDEAEKQSNTLEPIELPFGWSFRPDEELEKNEKSKWWE